jgi:hypothetical protein
MSFFDNNKIDSLAVDGLAGVSNSLAYKVHEIEKHFHSCEDWFGVADTPSGTHFADDMTDHTLAAPVDPFQIDAGNDVWGAWVQVFGTGDTPNRTDMVKFDLHKIQIVDSETANVHTFIQIGSGASGAAALSAGTYTTVAYLTPTAQSSHGAINFMQSRVAVGTAIWARCLAVATNTMTIDFYLGLHEYAG